MKQKLYDAKTHINGKLIEEDTPVEGFVLEQANADLTMFSIVHYRKINKTNRYRDIDVDTIEVDYPIMTIDDLNDLDKLVKESISMYNNSRGVKGNTSYKIRGDMFSYLFKN